MHFSLEFTAPKNYFTRRFLSTPAEDMLVPKLSSLTTHPQIIQEVAVEELSQHYRVYTVTQEGLDRLANKLALDVFKEIRLRKKRSFVSLEYPCIDLECYLTCEVSFQHTGTLFVPKQVSCLELTTNKPPRARPVHPAKRSRVAISADQDRHLDEIEFPVLPCKGRGIRLEVCEVPAFYTSVPPILDRPRRQQRALGEAGCVRLNLSDLAMLKGHTTEAIELCGLQVKRRKHEAKSVDLLTSLSGAVCSSLNLRRPLLVTTELMSVPKVSLLECKTLQVQLYELDQAPGLENSTDVVSRRTMGGSACEQALNCAGGNRRPFTLQLIGADCKVEIDVKVKLKRKASAKDSTSKQTQLNVTVMNSAQDVKAYFANKKSDDQAYFGSLPKETRQDGEDFFSRPLDSLQEGLACFNSMPREPFVDIQACFKSKPKEPFSEIQACFLETPKVPLEAAQAFKTKKQVRFSSQVDFFPFNSPTDQSRVTISSTSRLACIEALLRQWESLKVDLSDGVVSCLDMVIEDSAGVMCFSSSELRSEALLLARTKEIDKLPVHISRLLILLDAEACELSQVKRLLALVEMLRHDELSIVLELSPALEAAAASIAMFVLRGKQTLGAS